MEYRALGESGLTVSVIGMGCWPMAGVGWTGIDDNASLAALDAAMDGGITLIDTAYMYGRSGESERLVGRAIAGRRDQIVLATKCGLYWDGTTLLRDSSRKRVLEQVEESLRRLNTDYIDLYQVHAPDEETPFEETATTLAELKEQGKIRAIGVSNYDAAQMEEFARHAPLHSDQPPYNPLIRDIEAEILPHCRKNNIGVVSYWPLYKGLLTGKYGRGHRFPEGDSRNEDPRFQGEALDRTLDSLDRLKPIADEYGKSLAQLVIHWTARQPGITSVLCGATRPAHVEQNIEAVGWQLSDEHRGQVDGIIAEMGG